jgi:hypothetical protein
MLRVTTCVLVLGSIATAAAHSNAQAIGTQNRFAAGVHHEPGWARPVFPTSDQQAQIEATPIHLRPYRPLHFYGNTVRRQYYRGTPIPLPRDAVNASAAALGRRWDVEDYLHRHHAAMSSQVLSAAPAAPPPTTPPLHQSTWFSPSEEFAPATENTYGWSANRSASTLSGKPVAATDPNGWQPRQKAPR